VFAGVLDMQIENLRVPSAPSADPATAVADLMADACRGTLRHKHLAHAMITSLRPYVRSPARPDTTPCGI
jgi:hypothetical protein